MIKPEHLTPVKALLYHTIADGVRGAAASTRRVILTQVTLSLPPLMAISTLVFELLHRFGVHRHRVRAGVDAEKGESLFKGGDMC